MILQERRGNAPHTIQSFMSKLFSSYLFLISIDNAVSAICKVPQCTFLKSNLSGGIFSMYGGLLVFCLFVCMPSYKVLFLCSVIGSWQSGRLAAASSSSALAIRLWSRWFFVCPSIRLSGNLFCEFRAMQSNCQMSGLAIGMGLLKPEQPSKSHRTVSHQITDSEAG